MQKNKYALHCTTQAENATHERPRGQVRVDHLVKQVRVGLPGLAKDQDAPVAALDAVMAQFRGRALGQDVMPAQRCQRKDAKVEGRCVSLSGGCVAGQPETEG